MHYLQGRFDRAFVHEELMNIPENTQFSPECVRKWKLSRITFVTLLSYKNHTLIEAWYMVTKLEEYNLKGIEVIEGKENQ